MDSNMAATPIHLNEVTIRRIRDTAAMYDGYNSFILVLPSMAEKCILSPFGIFSLQYPAWPLGKNGTLPYCQSGIYFQPAELLIVSTVSHKKAVLHPLFQYFKRHFKKELNTEGLQRHWLCQNFALVHSQLIWKYFSTHLMIYLWWVTKTPHPSAAALAPSVKY